MREQIEETGKVVWRHAQVSQEKTENSCHDHGKGEFFKKDKTKNL